MGNTSLCIHTHLHKYVHIIMHEYFYVHISMNVLNSIVELEEIPSTYLAIASWVAKITPEHETFLTYTLFG